MHAETVRELSNLEPDLLDLHSMSSETCFINTAKQDCLFVPENKFGIRKLKVLCKVIAFYNLIQIFHAKFEITKLPR